MNKSSFISRISDISIVEIRNQITSTEYENNLQDIHIISYWWWERGPELYIWARSKKIISKDVHLSDIESESKIIFLISAYCYRITYKGKTYQLKYLYFASIFKFHQRSRNIGRWENYLRYFSKDSVVQTNSITRYLNIFAFLKWNRRYFYVITKTLNEEIKNSDRT